VIPQIRNRFSLFALAASLGISTTSGNAQDVASVVGVVSYPVAENRMISVGVPLMRPAVVAGIVDSVDSSGITLVNADGVRQTFDGVLQPGSSYYLDVVAQRDGQPTDFIGHRIEIDERATTALSSGKLVAEESSLNTLSKNNLGSLIDHRVVIRPHWTLATVFGTGTTAGLNSATAPAEADQVFFSTAKGLSVFYFRKATSPQWRSLATGSANQDNAIIPPGVGVYFKRQKSPVTFTVAGEVRSSRFVRSPVSSGQLLVSGFPIAASLSDLRLVSSAGLTSGVSATAADQVFRWDGASFESFFLKSGTAPVWQKASLDGLDYTSAKLLDASAAILVRLKSSVISPLVQTAPFSL
jgi:uncharacterized protein (TIGR02597 family)